MKERKKDRQKKTTNNKNHKTERQEKVDEKEIKKHSNKQPK